MSAETTFVCYTYGNKERFVSVSSISEASWDAENGVFSIIVGDPNGQCTEHRLTGDEAVRARAAICNASTRDNLGEWAKEKSATQPDSVGMSIAGTDPRKVQGGGMYIEGTDPRK